MGVEFTSIRLLAAHMGGIPKETAAELRPKLRAAAELVANQAKVNASYSSRIPGAIKVSTSLTSRNGGAGVRVDSRKAPHSRALEGTQDTASFRHPVFGRDAWVDQPTRPFLFPARDAKLQEVKALVADAVRSAVRFHP